MIPDKTVMKLSRDVENEMRQHRSQQRMVRAHFMMTLNKDGNYEPWVQPKYGTDAQDNPVTPPAGYVVLPESTVIRDGDIPFDVYAGWMQPDGWHWINKCYSQSDGRWTTWARPLRSNDPSSETTARP